MPTQAYQNRQGRTIFTLPADGTALDVLATAQRVTPNDYQEGMSVNGGAVLNFEIENLDGAHAVALVGYRRMTPTSAWSSFYTATIAASDKTTVKLNTIGGFSDVRITAAGAGATTQDIAFSASITML